MYNGKPDCNNHIEDAMTDGLFGRLFGLKLIDYDMIRVNGKNRLIFIFQNPLTEENPNPNNDYNRCGILGRLFIQKKGYRGMAYKVMMDISDEQLQSLLRVYRVEYSDFGEMGTTIYCSEDRLGANTVPQLNSLIHQIRDTADEAIKTLVEIRGENVRELKKDGIEETGKTKMNAENGSG